MLETPVVLILFNRPELTRRVMERIAQARPRRLLLVADGPRGPEDVERCMEARAAGEAVTWDCEVLRNYSEVNLRTRGRIPSGLEWAFGLCESAIVLEDDCLPDPTFFPFCEELLARYRDDERVTTVSGNCFVDGSSVLPRDSYYFSRYAHTWGWASWSRAWKHYDPNLELWPSLRETSWLQEILGEPVAVRYWRMIFDAVHARRVISWDYQWLFACWSQNGLGILPAVNLVSNIGFGPDATHTTHEVAGLSARPAREMEFPLRHPRCVFRSREADDLDFTVTFDVDGSFRYPGLYGRVRRRIQRLARRPRLNS